MEQSRGEGRCPSEKRGLFQLLQYRLKLIHLQVYRCCALRGPQSGRSFTDIRMPYRNPCALWSQNHSLCLKPQPRCCTSLAMWGSRGAKSELHKALACPCQHCTGRGGQHFLLSFTHIYMYIYTSISFFYVSIF